MTRSRQRLGAGARGQWWALVAGVVGLGAVEVLTVHLVAGALLPDVAALVVDVVLGLATLALVLALASPLWASVRLGPDALVVRFGWVGGVVVPRADVVAAGTWTGTAVRPVEIGAGHDDPADGGERTGAHGVVSFVRSARSPVVRLDLAAPVAARVAGTRRVTATTVLVGVDDPEPLLALAP
ncbi:MULTISPECIES: hypothetical protein [Cellulosimicrobium]|uniref:Uncharacterized protein n=1 Tax=Cellulosimicrobium sp. ES-005 TaxID=3163031 RepID=A0AAU8G5P7_9MICO|nr:hypothetical protein [Cellulosimicrobium cellulans]MCO7271818.1 hypothetical protein [Cellulosimicrobium cellulans]